MKKLKFNHLFIGVVVLLMVFNHLLSYFDFTEANLYLNFFVLPLALLILFIILPIDSTEKIFKKLKEDIFSEKTDVMYCHQIDENINYLVESIGLNKRGAKLISEEKKVVTVYDLIKKCPNIEVGNRIMRYDEWIYYIDKLGQKNISHIGKP